MRPTVRRTVENFPWATLSWLPASILLLFLGMVWRLDAARLTPTAVTDAIAKFGLVLAGLLCASAVLAVLGIYWAGQAIRQADARPRLRHWLAIGYGVLHVLLVLALYIARTVR